MAELAVFFVYSDRFGTHERTVSSERILRLPLSLSIVFCPFFSCLLCTLLCVRGALLTRQNLVDS